MRRPARRRCSPGDLPAPPAPSAGSRPRTGPRPRAPTGASTRSGLRSRRTSTRTSWDRGAVRAPRSPDAWPPRRSRRASAPPVPGALTFGFSSLPHPDASRHRPGEQEQARLSFRPPISPEVDALLLHAARTAGMNSNSRFVEQPAFESLNLRHGPASKPPRDPLVVVARALARSAHTRARPRPPLPQHAS